MTTSAFDRPQETWRTRPVYSLWQAASLASVSTRTVKRWVEGYSPSPWTEARPVFGERSHDTPYLSFLEVAEIVVVSAFRQQHVTLERIRLAHSYAASLLRLEFPFATADMKQYGLHIVTEFQSSDPGVSLLTLDAFGQWALPFAVSESLNTFEWLHHWASRWFPGGRDIPIVIDPQVAAGKPTVVDRNVTVETILRRFVAKQDPEYIAEDLEIDESNVIDIIRYGMQHQNLLAA